MLQKAITDKSAIPCRTDNPVCRFREAENVLKGKLFLLTQESQVGLPRL
jgi:hypothetical protein